MPRPRMNDANGRIRNFHCPDQLWDAYVAALDGRSASYGLRQHMQQFVEKVAAEQAMLEEARR